MRPEADSSPPISPPACTPNSPWNSRGGIAHRPHNRLRGRRPGRRLVGPQRARDPRQPHRRPLTWRPSLTTCLNTAGSFRMWLGPLHRGQPTQPTERAGRSILTDRVLRAPAPPDKAVADGGCLPTRTARTRHRATPTRRPHRRRARPHHRRSGHAGRVPLGRPHALPLRQHRSADRTGLLTTGSCVDVDQDALDQAFEDDINHSNRVIGTLGALTSTTALVLGWRLWRSPRVRRNRPVRRARTIIAAACLSPLAAVPIFVLVVVLYWSYDSIFE